MCPASLTERFQLKSLTTAYVHASKIPPSAATEPRTLPGAPCAELERLRSIQCALTGPSWSMAQSLLPSHCCGGQRNWAEPWRLERNREVCGAVRRSSRRGSAQFRWPETASSEECHR